MEYKNIAIQYLFILLETFMTSPFLVISNHFRVPTPPKAANITATIAAAGKAIVSPSKF